MQTALKISALNPVGQENIGGAQQTIVNSQDQSRAVNGDDDITTGVEGENESENPLMLEASIY